MVEQGETLNATLSLIGPVRWRTCAINILLWNFNTRS